MKKLVDETTDDLTRSLLVAGIEHRPPAGNKAQLLVALGAGGAVGLFSAKAFGWFGTGAGKVTLVGMAVGVAGAVYGVAPLLEATLFDARSEGATETAIAMDERDEPPSASEVVAPLLPAPANAAAPSDERVDEMAPRAVAAFPLVAAAGEKAEEPPKPKPAKLIKRAARAERVTGPLPAVEPPPAVGALAEQTEHPEEKTNQRSRLETEVKLVDDMHWAARRNDHEALGRFVETYRLQFPDGQLKAEVAAFAARLERGSPR